MTDGGAEDEMVGWAGEGQRGLSQIEAEELVGVGGRRDEGQPLYSLIQLTNYSVLQITISYLTS